MTQRRTPSGQGPGRRTSRDHASASASTEWSREVRSRSRAARGGARTTGRSSDRPAARRTAANRSGGTKRTRAPKPKGRFTGRAAILALVLSALVLAYAYPVRTYLTQRAEIERLATAQDEQVKRIAELERELKKWDDPEYVRAQARSRLHYIRPDEVPYVVIDSGKGDPDRAGAAKRDKGGAWHDRMWGSLAAADGGGT